MIEILKLVHSLSYCTVQFIFVDYRNALI